MVGTFLLTSASAATVINIALDQMKVTVLQLPGITSCVPLLIPKYIYAFWIPILAFETLLFILAVIRGVQTYRNNATSFQSGKRLVGVLVRDSIIYYTVMFVTYLTCLLIFLLNSMLLEVPIGFSIAFSCVLGNRVILNVREVTPKTKGSREVRVEAGNEASRKSALPPEQESDTLTDFEMAQLRSMRAESIEGVHVVV
ncbi:hypothetical protein GYMLUDRAFT_236692 [Collybiopsis luxurians FD-317 M1]|nr:hypothetical protein GYMLUDRAFT_236692 [Collybiopsis luxurians FD-317 M1]